MLRIEELDGGNVERSGALVAREHAAARRDCPELPAAYESAEACTAALQRLRDGGHRGLVAVRDGRALAVLTSTVREVRTIGRYARLPADGVAVDPELPDPTAVLVHVYAELAPPLVADGMLRHYLLHVVRPAVSGAVADLGFARDSVYGVQRTAPRPARSTVEVRVADEDELDTIAGLALVEIRHRAAPPMYAPPDDPPVADLVLMHRALRAGGAVHLLARLEGATPACSPSNRTRPRPGCARPASPTSARPPRHRTPAGTASAARSSTRRWTGPTATGSPGCRSTSRRPTRCRGRSGSAPASARPDTASCGSSSRRTRLAEPVASRLVEPAVASRPRVTGPV